MKKLEYRSDIMEPQEPDSKSKLEHKLECEPTYESSIEPESRVDGCDNLSRT